MPFYNRFVILSVNFFSFTKTIIRNIVLVIFLMFLLYSDLAGQSAKRYTISGYVREAGSRELLTGVNIFLSDHRTGTTTNNYGFFSLTLQESDSIEITLPISVSVPRQEVLAFSGKCSN